MVWMTRDALNPLLNAVLRTKTWDDVLACTYRLITSMIVLEGLTM